MKHHSSSRFFRRIGTLLLSALLCTGTIAAVIPAVLPVSAAESSPPAISASANSAYAFDDNIMISVYWPPTADYINETQYKYLADAGITWVMGAGDDDGADAITNPESQKRCWSCAQNTAWV